MKKVLRYYKPYLLVIAVIIALLAVRAQGELRLPDYMSDIVDIGISSNGVASPVPDAIRPAVLERLAALMDKEDGDAFLDAYSLLDRQQLTDAEYKKYVKQYPLLESSDLYILKSGTDITALEVPIARAVLTFLQASGAGNYPAEALAAMSDSIVVQAATAFAKSEYEALGMDMGSYQTSYILRKGVTMLLVLLIIMVSILGETYLAAKMAAGIAKALRRDVFAKVTGFSNNEFDKFSTASLITRSTNDIQQIQLISFLFLRFVVFSPLLGVGAVFKVINNGSGMTWIIGVSVAVTLILVIIIFAAVMPKFKVMQKFIDRLNLVSRESLTGVMVVRAFNREGYEEDKFDKANKDLRGLSLFVNRVFSFMNPAMNLLLSGTTLLIIWVGAQLINDGGMQVGTMMAFLQYAMQIINSFMMLTMITINIPRAMVSATRLAEILNTETSVKDPADSDIATFQSAHAGVVEFKNVSFKYPGATEYILQNISFTAKPGETTAFIGSTGSGKSTAINLIPRFYDVTEGQILVEGVDIRKVRTKDLRTKIGYIPQKGLLFSGSIESNIKYGEAAGTTITDDDMRLAAEIAQAADFINEKPDNYYEPISQAGTNVSGGQKQRLSIARAIAKKPGIFIFDDSFSALDYKTDAALRRAINEKLHGVTMLVVAQRIGTIKNAEQIVVLDQGRIAGIGRHQELLEQCEIYRQIALSQLSEKELGLTSPEDNGKEAGL